MANIEILDLTSKAEGLDVLQLDTSAPNSPEKDGDHAVATERSDGLAGGSSPASLSPESVSTPLRTTPVNGTSPAPSGAPTLSMPHPKKFSHVNINKKFLEKTSATSPSGQVLSTSSTAKPGNAVQKPVPQTVPTHSRLVTTKLTATSQSTTTGPGWSRPSSTVSSTAPTPSSATNTKAPALPAPTTSNNTAPQPTPVGKVIQPQPRGASDALSTIAKKDLPGKPAWGSARAAAAAAVSAADAVASDFPTAAEVAQGRTVKMMEKRQAAEVAAAQKQAVAAEEDTFRGVHLNPNAHHWDEMEEDDDNFLGGVIEFGDGRQYKIQPADASRHSSPSRDPTEVAPDGEADLAVPRQAPLISDQPVSKEERFAEDFDRSWPRSGNTSTFPHQPRDQHSNGPASSTSSQSHHSPQDASRVLFNERSNRLEPYSNTHPRQIVTGPPSHFSRRGSRSDHIVSPTESRSGRDAPPHPHTQGVQLLQKSSDSRADTFSHTRPMGDHTAYPATSPLDGPRFRDREPHRHDSNLPPHPMGRTPSQQSRSKDQYNYSLPSLSPVGSGTVPGDERPRRTSTMGPPPLPLPSPSEFSKSGGRQLPPHLSNIAPPPLPSRAGTVPEVRHPSSSRHVAESSSATLSPGRLPPISPVASLAPLSPVAPDKSLQSTMPLMDIEQVRKAAMHSAAERARLRRQQEEEERAKQKERAMKKAAELEAKMKAQETKDTVLSDKQASVSEAQAVSFIEDAVKVVSSPQVATADLRIPSEAPSAPESSSLLRSPSVRAPSLKGVPRGPRRSSFLASDAASSAAEAESWRSKTAARSPTVQYASPKVTSLPPPPPLLAEVESLALSSGDLEVFDFSDHGRLIGVETSEHVEPPVADGFIPRPPRAVATDFFDDDAADPGEPPTGSEETSWRRKHPTVDDHDQTATESDTATAVHPKERLRVQILSLASDSQSASGTGHAVIPSHPRQPDDLSRSYPAHAAHAPPLRSPLTPSYREAPMSALNDVISRIKGALDGMHPKQESLKPAKWLPPALRQKSIGEPTEVFDATMPEPPRDSPPAWGNFTVKLPSMSHPLGPEPRRRASVSKGPVRLNVFSWESIEGVHRRDFNFNDLVFRKPSMFKGRPRFFVKIPRIRIRPSPRGATTEERSGLKVHLPAKSAAPPPPTTGRTSGDVRPADSSNWRKANTPVSSQTTQANDLQVPELDTVSRSPPPEAPFNGSKEMSSSSGESNPTDSASGLRSRIQPKMPAGSDVAFYRDARVEAVLQAQPTVSFIVTSELEDDSNLKAPEAAPSKAIGERAIPMLPESKPEPRRTSQSPERPLITPPPPSNNGSWIMSPPAFSLKDSPARAPDPEHLKAVWSQASDKANLPSVNSLEAIADDLSAVPFTLQDVKSEDGETPPPSGSGPPSRMSLHDVTRAFQQVPTSNPRQNNPSSQIPSPTSSSAPRQPTFAFAPPPPANMRPTYPSYSSPMLSHSPSPTVMYPPHMTSPVPRPMMVNGASPQYPQHMWMPVQAQPGQNPGAMMRPVPSPYPAQLMSYPSPNMYGHPPNMPGPSQQPNGIPGRSNGMPILSPVMQPAHPNHAMYASSPVLMHSPAMMPLPPGTGYPGAAQTNRGQLRGGFEHSSAAPVISPSMSHPHPAQQQLYPSGPPNSFARPTW